MLIVFIVAFVTRPNSLLYIGAKQNERKKKRILYMRQKSKIRKRKKKKRQYTQVFRRLYLLFMFSNHLHLRWLKLMFLWLRPNRNEPKIDRQIRCLIRISQRHKKTCFDFKYYCFYAITTISVSGYRLFVCMLQVCSTKKVIQFDIRSEFNDFTPAIRTEHTHTN